MLTALSEKRLASRFAHRVARPSARTETLTAVAAAAGVSAMTVSRVLRSAPHVSADARGRVMAAAKKVGYQPNPQIARLMTIVRSAKGRRVRAAIGCDPRRHPGRRAARPRLPIRHAPRHPAARGAARLSRGGVLPRPRRPHARPAQLDPARAASRASSSPRNRRGPSGRSSTSRRSPRPPSATGCHPPPCTARAPT